MLSRRELLEIALRAAVAPIPATTACPAFRLRYGVTQIANHDLVSELDRLAQWGYDYCEPAVARTMTLEAGEFAAMRRKAEAGRIHVEAMNSFIPAALKVVGPAVDEAAVSRYVADALARADALGAKVVVFGSGDARRVPDGFPRAQAWSQLQRFLRAAGDEIERRHYGMVIGIEALRQAESNIVNRSSEAHALVVETAHPRIKMIVDFFHLTREGEDAKILLTVKEELVHLHFSNPENGGRAFPRGISESPGYASFFANLRAIGYQGRISIEANTTTFEDDLPAGLATVHKLYDAACA
jgi:D-psicose/D-tagatose/L-ribulose 3-epimerase